MKSASGSQYEELVKQRHAKLSKEQQMVAQIKRQREQQEMNEQADKVSRRKTWNNVLLAIFSILAITAGILIYFTYTN